MKTLKRISAAIALFSFMVCLFPAGASMSKSQTGDHIRATRAARHSSASRPYYGGGRHTVSHGGSYPGATNAHPTLQFQT